MRASSATLARHARVDRRRVARGFLLAVPVAVNDVDVATPTGRAVVVHEASRFCGYGAEVAARLSEQCFHFLEAPILRVAGFDIPYPPPHLEEYHLPSVDRILDAVDRLQWQETRPAVKAGG